MRFRPLPPEVLTLILVVGGVLILAWILMRSRPALRAMGAYLRQSEADRRFRKSESIELNHRRRTLLRAQSMHLASPLFALDDILVEPRLLAPPQHLNPGGEPGLEATVSQVLPYLPAWPELAAFYHAPTLSIQEGLAGGANLVLIGQPGSGKSVTLAALASLAASRDASLGALHEAVPFLLHVADLHPEYAQGSETLRPLVEAIAEHASVQDLPRLPSFVKACFRDGRALLLIDGYDELAPRNQEEVCTYVGEVLNGFPGTHVVTTGNPEHLNGLIRLGFAVLAVVPWSDRRSLEFIERWGQLWKREVGPADRQLWAESSEFPDLITAWLQTTTRTLTPLELTLALWNVHSADGSASHPSEIIAAHARRLARGRWRTEAIEALALKVVLTQSPVFDLRRGSDWMRPFEEEPRTSPRPPATPANAAVAGAAAPSADKTPTVPATTVDLLARLAASGLLTTHVGGRLRFAHPVLAAQAAANALTRHEASETILNQPEWWGKGLTLRYFAAREDAAALAAQLLRWSRLPMHRPLFEVARWLRMAPTPPAWTQQVLESLTTLLRAPGLPLSLRAQAVGALTSMGGARAASLLMGSLPTAEDDVLRLAALGLGFLRDRRAIPTLQDMLGSRDNDGRRAACLALAAIGTEEALEAIGRVLLSGDDEMRRASAEALAHCAPEGIDMLRDGLTMEDVQVRRAAVFGLGQIEEAWAAERLRESLLADDQWAVRSAAASALEYREARPQRAPRALTRPEDTPWIAQLADQAGRDVASADGAAAVTLMALKDPDPAKRCEAALRLRSYPTEPAIRGLYGAMYGEDGTLREISFNTLWELGSSGMKLPDPAQYGYS